MADYNEHNPYAYKNQLDNVGAAPKTGRVKKRVTSTTVFELGLPPYKVDDILDLAKQLADQPTGAKVEFNDSETGMEVKVTVG